MNTAQQMERIAKDGDELKHMCAMAVKFKYATKEIELYDDTLCALYTFKDGSELFLEIRRYSNEN